MDFACLGGFALGVIPIRAVHKTGKPLCLPNMPLFTIENVFLNLILETSACTCMWKVLSFPLVAYGHRYCLPCMQIGLLLVLIKMEMAGINGVEYVLVVVSK